MKFVVLLAVVAVVGWLWRAGRSSGDVKSSASPPPQTKPSTMADCPVCGVHFPPSDGVQGRVALYCSEAHRRASEA